jgi:hypothetical protein
MRLEPSLKEARRHCKGSNNWKHREEDDDTGRSDADGVGGKA